jgi:hypothetical protein
MTEEGEKPAPKIEELIGDNTEEVFFDPKHETGFGTKQVTIKGHEIEVHETHRFPDVLAVHMQPPVDHGTTKAAIELLAEINAPKFRTGDLSTVLHDLEAQKPRLYQELAGVVSQFWMGSDARNKAAQEFGKDSPEYETAAAQYRLSEEDINLRDYYFSKGIDAIGELASELDMEVNLVQICEEP